jgi:hypothetical protein
VSKQPKPPKSTKTARLAIGLHDSLRLTISRLEGRLDDANLRIARLEAAHTAARERLTTLEADLEARLEAARTTADGAPTRKRRPTTI